MEACGTSGMKASLNGVPHLSILDGWWIEGYNGKNGWAFKGSGDEEDSTAVYDLLEKEIVPLFYRTDAVGTPVEWVTCHEGGDKEHRCKVQRQEDGKRVRAEVLSECIDVNR